MGSCIYAHGQELLERTGGSFDLILVSQALSDGVPLVTANAVVARYSGAIVRV